VNSTLTDLAKKLKKNFTSTALEARSVEVNFTLTDLAKKIEKIFTSTALEARSVEVNFTLTDLAKKSQKIYFYRFGGQIGQSEFHFDRFGKKIEKFFTSTTLEARLVKVNFTLSYLAKKLKKNLLLPL
jgi:hypothetical protein